MLIPYSTERERERIPYATIALIGANVAVAAITFAHPEATLLLALTPKHLYLWQPLTAMFTRAGLEHLIGNMLPLWLFGAHVEDTVGIPRYLLLYLSAGVAADLLQTGGDLATLGEVRGGLGASGCIMGLVAVFATRYRKVKVNTLYCWYYRIGTWQVAAVYVAAGYVMLDVVLGSLGFFGVHDRIAHFAHLGGFAAGIGWAYAPHPPAEAAKERARGNAAELAAAGAYGAAAAALEAALRKRPDDAALHNEAATYSGLDDRTRSRAVLHWSRALRLWLAQGQRDLALEEWLRAKRRYDLREFDPALLCDLGIVLGEEGRYEEAVEAYGAAARHPGAGRTGPTAAMRTARLPEQIGRRDRAQEWYAYLVRTWPDSPESLEAADYAGQRLSPEEPHPRLNPS
jgi:membrane associated rhomboid family serine protease